jgi:hypothetical protein
MDIKSYIEAATARLQGEVGRFLILKEAIVKLPEGAQRSALMSTQNDLEQKAMSLLSRANAFKEAASFKGIDALKMFDPSRIKTMRDLGNEAAQTIIKIQNHKNSVALATNNPGLKTATPAQSGAFSVPPLLKLAAAVGAVAFGVNWMRREVRKRTR